ncbi:MAG TPA: HAMP domain-containing sensor histidine kinase [Candidatus Limnocylindrales bacterium]
MPATRSQSAESVPAALRSRLGNPLPRSLQARLTLAFVGVTALTLALVSTVVINRLDAYFQEQVKADLTNRAATIRDFANSVIAQYADGRPVVALDGTLNPNVAQVLSDSATLSILAQVGQADLRIRVGAVRVDVATGDNELIPSPGGTFSAQVQAQPQPGQAPDPIHVPPIVYASSRPFLYGIEITLTSPYTFRASTLAAATTLLFVVAIVALGVAVVVAAFLAERFTNPLRQLTEATRALADGDLASRVPSTLETAGSAEIAALSRQFNATAARLEESVETIRRDRDRSRDFLADVSHELRTPLAALRTFNELLREGAQDDPEARDEFLESSAQQVERLDWLAQNLLELSKLDSGLVLLDLRPDDLRSTVESAVEQAEAAARRRGVELTLTLPDRPVRVRHDPQRIGQVVSNLVGNALKFTARGGRVSVALRPHREGAEISIADSGVGIDATELPHIFERFYRGSRSNEARSSGSGLGLAIARSIVEMHRGRIAVESRLGRGSTFTVVLPGDPRSVAEPIDLPDGQPSVAMPRDVVETQPKVADSSSTAEPHLNPPASV